MRPSLLLLLGVTGLVLISGCAKDPTNGKGHFAVVQSYQGDHRLKYRINFQSNADWFAITLDKNGSDARFVLPDNPGIWIKDPSEQITSVKLSTTTLHIHRHAWANADMVSHNFYIESSQPEVIVRVDHGSNGRVVVRSDCDAFTTSGGPSQTFKMKLCRQ